MLWFREELLTGVAKYFILRYPRSRKYTVQDKVELCPCQLSHGEDLKILSFRQDKLSFVNNGIKIETLRIGADCQCSNSHLAWKESQWNYEKSKEIKTIINKTPTLTATFCTGLSTDCL